VAIADAARGKMLGHKLLTKEEIKLKKVAMEGVETAGSQSTAQGTGRGSRNNSTKTGASNQSGMLEEADEQNEKIIGRHVYPRSGLRVKLVKELNVNPENPAWKEEIHLEKWREAEGRPGIILEVVEEDMNYGILKNEFCRVMWDSTGLRVTYKTGYEGEYDLALYEVDDTNDDKEFELQKGRKLPLDMVMKRKKLKLEESKRNRFTQLYGNGNQRASMDNVRYFRGVKHLLGKDVDLTGSSKRDNMKPIDWLKMCFAVPMVKNQYPPVPTPLLQDPYADPYTHAGSPRASMFTPTKMGIRTATVAIVGAGVAAAVLARRLELLNYKITCFEKRNCQGGRLGNVRKGEEVMSLGCPYFQASSPAFIKEVQDWVDNGLVVPFDMNVGVLHGQCLGEVSHFDTLTPDPELYEKVKQMPNIMAANRSVVDSAGDVVGVRFGRFTTCRIWYDCASELWALEQQYEDIAKELAACEAAKDRAISGIRMIEYLLENMQTLKFITEPETGSMSIADGTGSMSNADKFYSKLALLQAQKSCKQTEKIFEFLKEEIKQRLTDEVELKKYLDPNERKIAQTRMLVRRKENRIQMEQKMGQSLPETCLTQTYLSSPRSSKIIPHQHEEPESTSSKVVIETCVPKRRNAIDEGNQPAIRRKAKGFVEEDEVAEEGRAMTWDEVLESFIPDVEFCQTWTLHSELISSMKEKWVLALRELHAAHIAIVKSEELLEIALLKLESAAKAIEQVKVYAAQPGPDQLVDVVVDLRYNKDFHPGDQIILHLPHFKLFDSHYKKLSVDTAGESKDTFKKATFFPKTQLLVLQHDSGSIFNAGTPIRIRVPRLVVIPKRGVSLEHSFEFTVRAEAVSGSSVLHALATALVDVPKKPTHVQLRKRDKVQDTEMELIHTDTLHDDEDGSEDLVQGDEKTQWATCMYDSEFSLMEALAPDDGLPRHRTAHVHAFESGLGPNQKLYMPTPKSAKMMEVLAPGVKYVYNHSVMAVLESDGKHRIIAQKDESEKEEEYGTQSGANVWRRGNTAGSNRPETADTDFSNSYGGSSRQTTGILKRQASPPRMSTAIAKKRLRNMGDFDLVLICTPPAVAARLTAQIAPQISAACQNARLQPCWVAYAKFEPVLSVSNDAFAVIKDPDNVLLWATRETSRFAKASSRDPSTFDEWRGMKMLLKGGRPSTAVAESQDKEDAWVLHASAEFSRNHLKTPPEEVAQMLIEHFVKMLDIDAVVDIIDTFGVLWEEGMYSDFGPYVSEELPEARTSEINFIATEKNGGWGRIGIDGALFDPARGIGVAGDWLVEGCVEGAFLSGQALANRVMDAHSSCVPADFTLAPSKFVAAESGIDHSDKWGYGEWPLLDVEEGKETFRWNGRPVTKRHARTVVAQPNPSGPPVGRPLTQAIHVDNADEAFANWMNTVRIDSARPSSQYHEHREAVIRKVQTDSMVDYLALPSRPTTQANKETEATISFEGPAPPLRHVKMLERPLEEWKMLQEKGLNFPSRI
jgi:predicted NAD/FAD-dependent oxidoreductase